MSYATHQLAGPTSKPKTSSECSRTPSKALIRIACRSLPWLAGKAARLCPRINQGVMSQTSVEEPLWRLNAMNTPLKTSLSLALLPLSIEPRVAAGTCLPARTRRPLSRLHEQWRCDYPAPAAACPVDANAAAAASLVSSS